MIPRYKFLPPNAMGEQEFISAKHLQEEGGRKLRFLTSESKPKFIGILKLYCILFGGTAVLWLFIWIVSLNLPDSGASKMYNGGFFEAIMGFLILASFYSLYGWLWEVLTCRNYNRKLCHMIKKSATYRDFRNRYFNAYGL
jgi:hypothetical protein